MSKSRSKINIAVRLVMLLLMIMSASWLFNQPSHSAAKDIFSKDRNGYFTGTHATEYHNVLPPIYNYNEYLGAKTPAAYAINVNELLDESGLATLKSNWRNAGVAMDIVDVNEFLRKMDQNRGDLIDRLRPLKRNAEALYKAYSEKYDQGLFNPSKNPNWKGVDHAELCVHNMARKWDGSNLNPAKIKSLEEFKDRINDCKKWAETGYDFIKYSLTGVPQHLAIEDKKNGNYNHYERYKKELLSNAKNIKMTLQYMPAGGRVNLPNQNTVSPGQNPFNTAARKGYDDVLKYPGGIKESMAIVAWNMENGKPKSARWTLRLRCANPTTADLAVRNVENPIEVSGRVVSNKISTAGTAEVEFRYSIAKTVANFPANAKTPIQYQFSGTPQAGFNHGNLEITGSNGAPGFNVGQRLGSNPAIFDTDIRGGKVEFVERYTINKTGSAEAINQIGGSGKVYRVCRKIETEAAQGRPHNFTAAEVKKLKHDAKACVQVSERSDANNNEGSIDVLGFQPIMTPIGEEFNPNGRGGVNTRVLRPKQWVPQQQDMRATDPCRSPYPESGDQRIERQCRNKCRPKQIKSGYNWRLEYVCGYEYDEDGDRYCAYTTAEQDGGYRCTWDANNPPDSGGVTETPSGEYNWTATRVKWWWVRDGNCYSSRRDDEDDRWDGYRWRQKFTREYGTVADEHIGTDENKIECEVVNAGSSSPPCSNSRECCPPIHYRGTCIWKERRPQATWSVTKIIFKPENGSGIDPAEKDGLPDLRNEEMTLDSSEAPLQYYCGKGSAFKNQKLECSTVNQGTSEIDNTKVFSLENPGWHRSLPSGMTWPYVPMNIVINPAGTNNYYYKNPPEKEGSFKGSILGGINKSSPGIADADANTVAELPTGTVVCYGLSLTPWKIDQPGRWAHSQPKCYIVSKRPYFSVEKGMVISGGMVKTSTNRRGGHQVGSWAEYNAIASGSVDDMFSTNLGSSVNVSRSASVNNSLWHKLTFANQGSKGNFGNSPEQLTNPVDFFSALDDGPYAKTTVKKYSGGSYNGGSIGAGIHVFEGDTTITGSSVGQPGQTVIVVKGDLTIDRTISSVNGWVAVSGVLKTSSHDLKPETIAKHGLNGDQGVVFNGPVSAGSIALYRTYGSGVWSPVGSLDRKDTRGSSSYGTDQFGQAAERFIDTPDTYIWSYRNSVDKGRVQTVYLREVAPRY